MRKSGGKTDSRVQLSSSSAFSVPLTRQKFKTLGLVAADNRQLLLRQPTEHSCVACIIYTGAVSEHLRSAARGPQNWQSHCA